MTAQALYTNNASTTLASGINSSVTSLTVASGKGALFPSPTGSNYFMCTLQSVSGSPIEIVQVTARSTDTFTIVRAQESTTAQSFSAGDIVELRLTAGELGGIPQLAASNNFTGPNQGTVTTNNSGSFDETLTNNFQCTPAGTLALTFTNHTVGQSGYVLLINTGGYAITAAATTKLGSSTLTTISTAGTYLLSYYDNGTNAYVTASGALA